MPVNDIYLEDVFATASRPWAAVGNGECNMHLGSYIDSFPTVVRFNLYTTSGYEDRVGKKTTYWCVGMAPDHIKPGVTIISPIHPSRKKDLDHLVIRPKKTIDWPGFHYTTGYALLALLEKHAIPTVVFNMDGLKTGHYFNKEHKHHSSHDGNRENALIEQMKFVRKFNVFGTL